MAKTYIDIVKYVVEANFEISGAVEKPDIIGAIFGQTEGLLGGDLDLRELQKNGKIGRIEIESASSGGKTRGKLYLPSSIGRVETCVLGAAIESVDRVGPYETVFKVEKIGDTRSEKRKKIIDRAKELVKSMLNTEIPDSKEISDLVESDVKSSIVGVYGQDKLPAGLRRRGDKGVPGLPRAPALYYRRQMPVMRRMYASQRVYEVRPCDRKPYEKLVRH